MQSLLAFLSRIRYLLLFILLEGIALWLVYSNNPLQHAAFFSSSNRVSGNISLATNTTRNYFRLKTINQKIAEENSQLRDSLYFLKKTLEAYQLEVLAGLDKQYEVVAAMVIDNSITGYDNYFVINKGKKDGLTEGLGIVLPNGIAGKTESCSDHFCRAYSFLHSRMSVSVKIPKINAQAVLKWNQKSSISANLLYLPRHLAPKIGDEIYTAGFSALYPEDIPIGKITNVWLPESAAFYDIEVELYADFSQLDYVYVVKDLVKKELDSLMTNSENES